LSIVEKLTGNEQIMAALVCKTLGAVVETSTVRKIANICHYLLGRKDPAMMLTYSSDFNDDVLNKWHECGYDGPKVRHHYWYETVATQNQYSSLKESVGVWLGPKYKYCIACHKFRPDDEKFWKLFAEYENPGILQKSTLKETKKNAKKIAHENDAAEKVEQAINYWCGAMELNGLTINGSLQDRSCPAHMMLEERRNGERVLKRWTCGA
jgi:hypothetical protein